MKALLIDALVNAINEFMVNLTLNDPNHPKDQELCSALYEGDLDNHEEYYFADSPDYDHHATDPYLGVLKANKKSIRVFSREECTKITMEARHFLMQVEKIGAIDASIREEILDAAMAMKVDVVDREQLKWMVFGIAAAKVLRKKVATDNAYY